MLVLGSLFLACGASTPPGLPSELPLLFMEPGDLVDPWGKQFLEAPDTQNMTSSLCPGCDLSHPGLQQLVPGGLMGPNPLRPTAGIELLFASASELSIVTRAELEQSDGPEAATDREWHPQYARSIYFMTTLDFITYTPAIRVASINQLNETTDPARPWLAPHSCLAKSIARSHDGSRYTMLTTCADEGIRPMVAAINATAQQGSAGNSLALDSFTPQRLIPAFWDHDVFVAGYSATSTEVVDLQITFQNQNGTAGWSGVGLKYCDNVGLNYCKAGYRRVVTLRTSQDGGLTWSNRAACPSEVWGPSQKQQPFDPQFRLCDTAGGWNQTGMIVPQTPESGSSVDEASTADPPELEFYMLTPMFVGNTTRLVGHALMYAPAPLPLLGYNYGMQPPLGPLNKVTGKVDLRQAHGPGIGLERWIGPSNGDIAALPMSEAWRRPFRSQPARDSRWFGEGGMIFRDHHVWYNKQSRELLGLPAYRLAGYRSVANSEFSTHVFKVPPKPLWVNADVHWDGTTDGPSFGGCFEGCAAYLMVAVLNGTTDAVLPGYEERRCVMMNVDSTRLMLAWNGSKPLHEQHVGESIRLRLFYRDATVFAVGA